MARKIYPAGLVAPLVQAAHAVVNDASPTNVDKLAVELNAMLTQRTFRQQRLHGRLEVRAEVTEIKYHRPPTPSEIKRGEGATHYRTFPVEECLHKGTRIKKRWLVAQDDGLRYFSN